MEHIEDIEFLEEFRDLVDKYLFLGYAPSRLSIDYDQMTEALEDPSFQEMRRKMNYMKRRMLILFDEYNFQGEIVYQLPSAAGGGELSVSLLDVITENPFPMSVNKHFLLDMIDQVIGAIQTGNISKSVIPMTKSNLVFIAMPMSPDDHTLVDVHEAIKEVARDIGLEAERTDDQYSNERITNRIIESLRSAEYVVADLTHSKPNVYWEAGYAHALGKTPIYIARAGTNIEFDLKDYPVIFFKNITELKQELKRRLNGLKTQHKN